MPRYVSGKAWRQLIVAGLLFLASLPWLAVLLMGVWRGVAVIEPCDRKAREQFGPEVGALVDRGREHVRWWPPAWECPLVSGESVSVSITG